eukprot:TRINITY_DN60641_c0_g1_i1.p1 TRINITY_DN60641_c0_g1~~TRINITY_DN60641_c0_g1_i1.p1  ORF type:complete len:318 (-),score=87.86 TRINITY_DN60641_c0_g1_i1:96-1049(-)
MLQNWKKNMVVRSEETNENDVIVIEDSDSDTDIEIEFERVEEGSNHPIGFSRGMNMGFPLLVSDYHDVLEEINKDLGISNNMMEFSSNMFGKELPSEEVFSIEPPSLNLQEPHSTEAPKQDYKHDYDKLVEQNRILMNSLNNILECPVCLTMVRTSPVPSCHNGHIMCSSCWNLTHLCPLCRVKLHETEKCFSQTANTLLQLVTLPCQYQDEGCRAMGSREEMGQHAKECMFRIDDQDPKTPTECSTPGCSIGRKKKVDKKGVLGIRSISSMSIRRNVAASPRRHCDDCNKDFSRSYFNRHTCTHSHSALHRTQNTA